MPPSARCDSTRYLRSSTWPTSVGWTAGDTPPSLETCGGPAREAPPPLGDRLRYIRALRARTLRTYALVSAYIPCACTPARPWVPAPPPCAGPPASPW